MQRYSSCYNIIVDGDEFVSGILGLSWFPSKNAENNKNGYETSVIAALDRLVHTWTGWCVMTEIYHSGKTLKILPYHASPKDPFNAYAAPTDVAAATLGDTTARGNDGKMPELGKPRITGTGMGSDSILYYSPSTWAPGSGAPTGPGATADEILLHEMVHGMRQMRGRSDRIAIKENAGMDNFEEFIAILLSNIYRSEKGISQFRSDHHGFIALTGPTATAEGFKAAYGHYLTDLDVDSPRLCNNLRRTVTTAFNPLL